LHKPADSPDRPVGLLERQAHLAALEEQFARVAASARGQVVLISGEAGVGKTSLVRQFCAGRSAKVRVLAGACDALFTPAPLGPLLDVALLDRPGDLTIAGPASPISTAGRRRRVRR
jgi:predicted ATPase